MSKLEKKKAKIKERISELEALLLDSLTKKKSSNAEINVPEITEQIKKLKADFVKLV